MGEAIMSTVNLARRIGTARGSGRGTLAGGRSGSWFGGRWGSIWAQ